MHIPDGFINAGTSAGAAVIAAGGVAVAVRKTSEYLEDKQVPLAGLTAAFVFAVQMLNFPVAAGTSGHLLGGALAAVLVGPWAGALCVTVVLIVQAFFADGGISALGLNIIDMGLVTALGGYAIFTGLRKLLPDTHTAVVLSSGVAAGISVVLSALAFFAQFALGANIELPLGSVFTAMLGVHLLIGVGEGLITAATIGLVLDVRPDLVHGARDLMTPLELKPRMGTAGGGS
ncbi:MAG: energy-coupling factor ABC transporter permease [Actinomycetota bacterium]